MRRRRPSSARDRLRPLEQGGDWRTTGAHCGGFRHVDPVGGSAIPNPKRLGVGLNVLLSSEPSGDNLGLFRPFLGDHYPMAQKIGWISTARHTAALVYTSHGPVVVVVLTFRSAGITRSEAARAAEQVLALARP